MAGRPAYLATAILCSLSCACNSGVSGHAYYSNGGVIQVEFERGGVASVRVGHVTHACTYSESRRSLRLVCGQNTINFTVQDDGALVGPADSQMARLTPMLN